MAWSNSHSFTVNADGNNKNKLRLKGWQIELHEKILETLALNNFHNKKKILWNLLFMITASYYNYAMMLEKKVIKHEKYDKSQINLGGLVASNSYKKN